MLEKIDTSKKMGKKEYKGLMEQLQPELAVLQRKYTELKIPVILVFEGYGASGKGAMIAKLIEPLDPRGFKVYATERTNDEEKKHPFLVRFFTKLPAKGRIAIFDRSWYTKVLRERLDRMTTEAELEYAYDEINNFEKLLVDDGAVIIKLFLHISKEEQKKRFEELKSNESTAWRVSKADWEHNKHYKECIRVGNEMLEMTDKEYAPWTIIEAEDPEYAAAKMYQTVISRLQQEIEKNNTSAVKAEESIKKSEESSENPEEVHLVSNEDRFLNGVLNGIDLSKDITKEEYKKKLAKLQRKLKLLQDDMYQKGIPSVLVFEGWDAAGKGGAIKRLTQQLDPRAYEVIPISAPDETERAHHYLWRFYKHIPKAGHLAIFDRSWYGRVMVERIEGFCSVQEWSRAYSEINHFEEQLTNAGAVVIKFWLHIDKDEQEKRFHERQETPGKEWKITDEDWRNRSKWEEYEKAVDEMLVRTSTTYAPWIVVEANSKPYARIKVLETVVKAYEKKLHLYDKGKEC